MDILVIEDCSNTRNLLARIFASQNLSVGLVANGRAAFQLLSRTTELPELILCDIIMPSMNGLAFRFLQMRHPRFQYIPLILMSGHSHFQRHAQCLGVEHFIEKPFTQHDLLQTISHYCPLSRTKRASLAIYKSPLAS